MLPGAKILAIVGLVSFCSNWQFGFQITYINTASRAFYLLADQIYQESEEGGEAHLPLGQWGQEWSAILTAFYAGALNGFILVPRLIRKAGGVRNALLWSSLPAVFGCLLQLGIRLSATNLAFDLVLSLGRLLVGIQAGCSLCLLPLFIIETSAFGHRPFLSSLQQVFQSLATLIGLVVGSDSLLALGPYKLEWLQMISLMPTLLFVLFLIWLPETPFRLLEKCQMDECCEGKEDQNQLELAFERSALFYYGPRADFSAIREEAFQRWRMPYQQAGQSWKRQRPLVDNLKGFLIGTLASISFTFTADDLIDSYSADFLSRSSNAPEASAETLTALLGLLLLITSIFGALLVENFGRRRLLISGLIGTALSNALASLGAGLGSIPLVTVGFAFTKAFIGFGAGAPAWFLTSELVSPLFVAQAQAISTGSLLIATGLSTLSFLSLQVWLGSAGALLCLSTAPALLIAFFLFLMLPETREQHFEQVRHLLGHYPLPGLASHPKWSRALLKPLLGKDKEGEGEEEEDNAWQRSWQLPHRAQRLMSSSYYVSYGSLSPQPLGTRTRPPFFRRHSAIPAEESPPPPPSAAGPSSTNGHHLPSVGLLRSSTFTSPEDLLEEPKEKEKGPFL